MWVKADVSNESRLVILLPDVFGLCDYSVSNLHVLVSTYVSVFMLIKKIK